MKRILAVILFALAASTFAFGQCSDADRQKLEAWDKALGDASRSGDRAFLQTAYADDYKGLSPSGAMVTKAQIIENTLRQAEQDKANPQAAAAVSYDHYDITCTQNTAVISHRNVITTKDPSGKEQTEYARSIHILEKRGGNWMMVSNAGHPLSDGANLLYMDRDLFAAQMRNDTKMFEQMASDDYISINPLGTIMTRAQAIAGAKNFKFESLNTDEVQTRVHGDTAVVTGRVIVKGQISGTPMGTQDISGQYRYMRVYYKEHGRWRPVAFQITPIAQQPASATQPTARQ